MMRRRERRRRRFEDEDVNPITYVSNLSDVMLIFAVGIMLALVTYWRVDMTPPQQYVVTEDGQVVDVSSAQTFTEEEREKMRSDATEGEAREGMEKTGEVYYDPDTQTYYIVEMPAQGEQAAPEGEISPQP